MHCKLVITVLVGFLPLVTLGDATNIESSASSEKGRVPSSPPLNAATNQNPRTLRLKVTCRSGAVVILDNAALVERGVRNEGYNPQPTGGTVLSAVRLEMPEGGTVTISWDEIAKITVGDRPPSDNTYSIEVTLKNAKQTKVGKTYGYDNTIVGRSDVGEFNIQLKDVKEIVTLPPAGAR